MNDSCVLKIEGLASKFDGIPCFLKGGWRWTLDESICQLLKPLRIHQDPKIRAESPLYNTCQPRTKTQPDAQAPCRAQPDATAANATETIAIDEGNQITCCSTWNAEICRVFIFFLNVFMPVRWPKTTMCKSVDTGIYLKNYHPKFNPPKNYLLPQNCTKNRSWASSCISFFFQGVLYLGCPLFLTKFHPRCKGHLLAVRRAGCKSSACYATVYAAATQ